LPVSSDNFAHNDVAGNFSLTLIDSLDTLVVLNDRGGFEDAVRNVIRWVSFDVNTKPQIFETNIRVLGGLLSGHLFAGRTGQPFYLPWYRGELLKMAHDLGQRLLPAFSTPTGLPYARVSDDDLLGVRTCECVYVDKPSPWSSPRRERRNL
jgi:mannosidase alpha-like ER degradation enhancer 1